METIVNYLKFFAIVGGILLFGLIFKWLGLLHWYDLIWEVFMRALLLGLIAFVAFVVDGMVTDSWRNTEYHKKSRGIVWFVALLGAAVTMTFFHNWFPEF